MGFLIGLFTFVMILDCIILVFLVLIQLPKKEAGAGLAFGASATDALFGAGSGTVLTKITKYSAGIFFVLAVVLSVMQSFYHSRAGNKFLGTLDKPPAQTAPAVTPPVAPGTNALSVPTTSTNQPVIPLEAPVTNAPANTNSPAASTNAAPKQ
jgi:preprotein translocase subunit SecG